MRPTLGESDCEFLGGGVLAQPVNALTSLAYVAAGVVVAAVAFRRGGERQTSLVFAALLASIGVGSVAFHGPQPVGARLLHDVPIVATGVFVVAMVAWDLRRRRRWRRSDLIVFSLGAASAAAAWVLGRSTSPTCDPRSVFQFHGVWHVLSAIALGQWWLVSSSGPGRRTAYPGVRQGRQDDERGELR